MSIIWRVLALACVAAMPASLLAQSPQINWSWANMTIPSGNSYGIAAFCSGGASSTITIYKNGVFFASGTGGASNSSSDIGPATITYTAVASGYPSATLFVTIAPRLNQLTVSSQNVSLPFGIPFTPPHSGGSGSGNWQWCIGGHTDLPVDGDGGAGTRIGSTLHASWIAPQLGNYSFWVRKFGDNSYNMSNTAGPYTLTIYNNAPTVSLSANLSSATVGQTVTLTISGADVDGNLRAVNLWVHTPNTPWRNIRANNTINGGFVENNTTDNAISSSGANVASLGAANRTFTFTLNEGFGTYMFVARSIDAASATSASAQVNVTVANRAPVANAQSVSTNEDTPKAITLGASDLDGQTLTYTIVTNPTKGTLSGSGANRTYTPAANQNGSDSFSFRVNDGLANSNTATVSLTVNAVNDAPTISDITNRTINEDTNTGAIPFTIGDVETAAGSLTLSKNSNNTTLVPLNNIVFGGSGANRTVTVTPAANQFGTATITVTVSDGNLPANDTFLLTVNSVNDAPTISNITDKQLIEGYQITTGAIPFTIGDVETPTGSLAVSASSTNTTLVPVNNIVFGGSDANRTVTINPANHVSGSSTVTVTVHDGTTSTSDTFVVTVHDADADYDGDGMSNGWERDEGLDPFVSNANGDPDGDGISNIDEYNAWTDPTSPTSPDALWTSAAPVILQTPAIHLTVMAKGTGTVTLTVDGVPHIFRFQPPPGNVWSEAHIAGNHPEWVQSASLPADFGQDATVGVSVSGVTDYYVTAVPLGDHQRHSRPWVEINERFHTSIAKADVQGTSFTVRKRYGGELAFGAVDLSTIEAKRELVFGFGVHHAGITPGRLVYSLGGLMKTGILGASIIKGEAMEGFHETPLRFQAKVPAGWVDVVRTRYTLTVTYYKDFAAFTPGTFRSFSGITPSSTYVIEFLSSGLSSPAPTPNFRSFETPEWINRGQQLVRLTRTAGGASSLFEQEVFWYEAPRHNEHSYTVPNGGPNVTQWVDLFSTVSQHWGWRTSGAPRQGLTRIEAHTEEPVYQHNGGTPVRSFSSIEFDVHRYLGSTTASGLGSYEYLNTSGSDRDLHTLRLVQRGQGADQHEVARQVNVPSAMSRPASATYNGLGGGTVTEYFGWAWSWDGPINNLDGQPALALGKPKRQVQSFGDNPVPSSITQPLATDLVTDFTYSTELADGQVVPASSVTKQGSVVVAKSEMAYAPGGTFNGQPTLTTTVTSYSNATTSKKIVTRAYSRNVVDPSLRSKTISVITPLSDPGGNAPFGPKKSYAYRRGTYYNNTWSPYPEVLPYSPQSPPPGAPILGSHLLVAELSGKTGTGVSSYPASNGVDVETLEMEANRSTVSEKILDADGRVLREASYVYTGSGFAQLSATYFGYDRHNNLIMTADQPVTVDAITDVPTTAAAARILFHASYTGWRKNWETDAEGTKLLYTYDNYDRVLTATREASGTSGNADYIPPVTTTYEYDPLGRLKKQTVSSPTETDTLVTEYTYDTAGRVKKVTAPGGYVTETTYNSPVQTTVTAKGNDTGSPANITTITNIFKDGRKKSTSGTGATDVTYSYAFNASTGFLTTTETFTGISPNPWSKVTTDWLGRTERTEVPTFNSSSVTRQEIMTYTYAGQLSKQETKSGSTSLTLPRVFEYDTYGRLKREGLEANGVANLQPDGDLDVVDHMAKFEQKQVKRLMDEAVINTGNEWYLVEADTVYPYGVDVEGGTNRSGEGRYAFQNYTQLTGLSSSLAAHSFSYDFDLNWTQTVTTIDRTNKRTVAETNIRGSNQLLQTVTRNGQVVESRNAQGQTFLSTYDGLGRLEGNSDPRIVTPTSYEYKPGTTMLQKVTAPDAKFTTTAYDKLGRVFSETDPAGKTSYFAYDDRGLVTHTWGDVPNPVMFEYDAIGRQVKMHTFRSGTWTGSTLPTSAFNGTRDTTEWVYDAVSGLLKQKIAAKGGAGGTTTYAYDTLGRQTQRTDPRGWVTNYQFYGVGEYNVSLGHIPGLLKKVDYTDAVTTDVEYFYHRTGKLKKVNDAAGTRTFNYYESFANSAYESDLRDKSGALQSETVNPFLGGSQYVQTYDYQYGVTGRANGPTASVQLVNQATYQVNYTYDDRLRVATIGLHGATPFTYGYLANSNLIDTVMQGPLASYTYRRDYDYESLSDRLSKVIHRSGPGSANDARQVETRLTYNSRGLRETEMTKGADFMSALAQGGFASANGLGTQYVFNDRYELGNVDKYHLTTGWAINTGATIPSGDRDYFYDPIGNRTSEKIGTAAVANYTMRTFSNQKSENEYLNTPYGSGLTYDNNGNLLTDPNNGAARTCTYDGENRLRTLTQNGVTTTYKYDYLGRRISKIVGSTETRFVYDGWNLIAELSNTNAVTRRFVWGLDVSGTTQGAGGVGGLLSIVTSNATYTPIFDASHNVIGLYDHNGVVAAAYEFDPFGNLLRSGGLGSFTYQGSNPFRFSTKYTDSESALVYYGHRYYTPLLARFLNRDPIAEVGGLNLYGFCGNDGVNRWDYLGMEPTETVEGGTLPPFVVTESRWDPIDEYQQQMTIDAVNAGRLALNTSLGNLTSQQQLTGLDPSAVTSISDTTSEELKRAAQFRAFLKSISQPAPQWLVNELQKTPRGRDLLRLLRSGELVLVVANPNFLLKNKQNPAPHALVLRAVHISQLGLNAIGAKSGAAVNLPRIDGDAANSGGKFTKGELAAIVIDNELVGFDLGQNDRAYKAAAQRGDHRAMAQMEQNAQLANPIVSPSNPIWGMMQRTINDPNGPYGRATAAGAAAAAAAASGSTPPPQPYDAAANPQIPAGAVIWTF